MSLTEDTVITACPMSMPYTTPFSTLAMLSFDEVHVMLLSGASHGYTDAVSSVFAPLRMLTFAGDTVTFDTGVSDGRGAEEAETV